MPRRDNSTDTHQKRTFPARNPPAWIPAVVAARNHRSARRLEDGRIGWVLLWLLGIPLPILLGLYFLRGCT